MLSRTCPIANTTGTPIKIPAPTSANPSCRIIHTTPLRVAPKAMRIPISFVRRVTAYARMPYSPMLARTSATVPNAVDNEATSRSRSSACSTCFSMVETLVIKSVERTLWICRLTGSAKLVAGSGAPHGKGKPVDSI